MEAVREISKLEHSRMKGLLLAAGFTQEEAERGGSKYGITTGKEYCFINGCNSAEERTKLYSYLVKSSLSNAFEFKCGRYLTFRRKEVVTKDAGLRAKVSSMLIRWGKKLV